MAKPEPLLAIDRGTASRLYPNLADDEAERVLAG
jgi:hypothetical protein